MTTSSLIAKVFNLEYVSLMIIASMLLLLPPRSADNFFLLNINNFVITYGQRNQSAHSLSTPTMPTQIPQRLVPGPSIVIELQMLAVIVSAFVCGLVFSLSASCLHLVYRKLRQNSNQASNRRNLFVLAYIVFMACLSMASVIIDTISVTRTIFTSPSVSGFSTSLFPGGARAICLMLAIWGADGFMVSFFYLFRS